VRREVQGELEPIVQGWHNLRCPNYVAQEELVYRPDARRYEAGTHNLPGIVGLRASLEMLAEIGIESIAGELLRKRAWLIPALQEKGWTVLQAEAPARNSSGIVTFYREGEAMGEIHAKLERNGVIASLRADRRNQSYIRLAPHFYNTDAELRRVLELL
jgi:selenocysteine lyase/cysteine desulfurase